MQKVVIKNLMKNVLIPTLREKRKKVKKKENKLQVKNDNLVSCYIVHYHIIAWFHILNIYECGLWRLGYFFGTFRHDFDSSCEGRLWTPSQIYLDITNWRGPTSIPPSPHSHFVQIHGWERLCMSGPFLLLDLPFLAVTFLNSPKPSSLVQFV